MRKILLSAILSTSIFAEYQVLNNKVCSIFIKDNKLEYIDDFKECPKRTHILTYYQTIISINKNDLNHNGKIVFISNNDMSPIGKWKELVEKYNKNSLNNINETNFLYFFELKKIPEFSNNLIPGQKILLNGAEFQFVKFLPQFTHTFDKYPKNYIVLKPFNEKEYKDKLKKLESVLLFKTSKHHDN